MAEREASHVLCPMVPSSGPGPLRLQQPVSELISQSGQVGIRLRPLGSPGPDRPDYKPARAKHPELTNTGQFSTARSRQVGWLRWANRPDLAWPGLT